MLHISRNNITNNKENKNSTFKTNFQSFEIKEKKTKPIVINMKKSLSLDNFWPNTPPSDSPNDSFLHSLDSFLKKKQ